MKAFAAATLLAVLALSLTACSRKDVAYHYYKEMGKDMAAPARTQVEHDGRVARTMILNIDKANEDLTRLLLLDRPSRSMYYPVD